VIYPKTSKMLAKRLIKALSRQGYKCFLARLNIFYIEEEEIIGIEHVDKRREDY
jgi:hypothetical protein